jgi:hypothetical protein
MFPPHPTCRAETSSLNNLRVILYISEIYYSSSVSYCVTAVTAINSITVKIKQNIYVEITFLLVLVLQELINHWTVVFWIVMLFGCVGGY